MMKLVCFVFTQWCVTLAMSEDSFLRAIFQQMEVSDNGYIYRYSSDLLTWKDHEKHAVQWGGHLASIHSEKETKTVSSLVRKYRGDIETWKGYPYIGGLKKKLVNGKGDLDGTMRMWRWSDGTDFDYTPWNTGQPDNDRGNEDVIIYNYHSNSFNDAPSSFKKDAVYKKPEPKTCAGPGESCTKRLDCCQDTPLFCGQKPNNGLCLKGNCPDLEAMCVQCVSDYQCPTTVTCENPGTALATCAMGDQKRFSGVNELLNGYNIFKSDPLRLAGPEDPGITSRQIWKFDYFDSHAKRDALDGEMKDLPRGVDVTKDYPVCESSFESKSITSSLSYSSAISESISMEASGSLESEGIPINLEGGMGLGGYAAMQFNREVGESNTSVKSQCVVKTFRRSYEFLDLSDELKRHLEEDFIESETGYEELFGTFGTHVPREVIVGAAYGASTSISEKQESLVIAKGMTMDQASSAGIPFFFQYEEKTDIKSDSAASTALQTANIRFKDWSIGGDPSQAFKQGVYEFPAPLKFHELESICEVIHYYYAYIDRMTCYKSYEPYCDSVMKKLGSEIDCDAMLSDVRPEFDCILNAHCPGKYQGCNEGMCERVVVKLIKVLFYDNPVTSFNEEDWVKAKLPALPRKGVNGVSQKGVVKLCPSEKSATVQAQWYVNYLPMWVINELNSYVLHVDGSNDWKDEYSSVFIVPENVDCNGLGQ